MYDFSNRAFVREQFSHFADFPSRAMWHSVLMAGRVKTRPGWGIGKRSDGFLLHWITRGRGWVRTRHRQHEARAGDLIFLDCHTPYELGVDARDPWEMHWVSFDSGMAHNWVEALGCDRKPVIRPDHPRRMARSFERIMALLRRKPPGFEGHASVVIHSIMAGLFAQRARVEDPRAEAPVAQRGQLPPAIRRVLEFIPHSFQQRTPVLELTRVSGLSRSMLYAEFQRHLGISPLEYLNQFRIRHASELLRHTNLSVKEIGGRVGFEDANYFSRLFRQKSGMGARVYRARTNRLLGVRDGRTGPLQTPREGLAFIPPPARSPRSPAGRRGATGAASSPRRAK